jgi:peptidoglycan glycosyltransferase/penicillin-binding protein 2
MEKGQRNLRIILWITMAIFVALSLRLGYIQLLGHEDLSEVTRAQSMISLKGSDTRATILDRNGVAVAGKNKKYIYIIKSDRMTAGAENYLQMAGATEINGENENYNVYTSSEYDKNAAEKLVKNNKAYILQASTRYGENQMAEHFIGYINEKDVSGASGIELMYDENLSSFNKKIYAVADVTGEILQGRKLEIISGDKNDSSIEDEIIVTLDSEIQKAVEGITNKNENACGVVILDVKDGGVVAMVSTPGFDPNNIQKYVSQGTDELLNKVTQGEYPPGSVFKIIVAAAALEDGISQNQEMTCKGHVLIDNVNIKCDTGGENGHGNIDMTNAFAQSCNCYFVQLAQTVGAHKILKMAQAFGLGDVVINGFPYEAKGMLMTSQQSLGAGVGNLGIGQGETLVTPLQVAAMTNIIATGGNDIGVKVLMEDSINAERVISQANAEIIKNMMIRTATEGTASLLEMDAAVKTGTAEYISDNETRTHAWITGFTPSEDPEYTITVFVEDGGSGSQTAGPILKEIIDYLQKSGSYSKPTLA